LSVDQIAIRAVDLDAVETGLDRVAGGIHIVDDDPVDVGLCCRSRLLINLLALIGVGKVGRGSWRRGDRLASAKVGMDQPAHVPQLRDDAPAGPVDRLRDALPPFDLRIVPEARRVRPAKTLAGDSGRFGNDEAGAGALRIIAGHQLVRHAFPASAGPGQWSHENPVGELKRAELERVEKARHQSPFSNMRGVPQRRGER
jgi:hypothetical protein